MNYDVIAQYIKLIGELCKTRASLADVATTPSMNSVIYLFAFQIVALSATTGLSQAQQIRGFAFEYTLITASSFSHCELALVASSLRHVQLQYRIRNQGDEEGNGNSATGPGWRNLTFSESSITGWQL